MPEHAHPASLTATDLLKNLTEKIGTHTLFYDQKKSKAKPQQTIGIHSAGSVPVPFGGLLRGSQMKQLQGVEQHASTMWWLNIFAGNLWTAEARAGYSTLPQWVSMAQVLPGISICPLCYKQSQETSRVGTTGTAAALLCRHSTTFENSLFYIYAALFQCT